MNRLPQWFQESMRVNLWFLGVFTGANALTALHGWRIPIHFQWEVGLPFFPQAAPLYLSIAPTMGWVAYSLRHDPAALMHFRKVLVTEILIAGIFFVLLPAELAPGFARTAEAPWSALVAASATVGLQYNLFPSLHVAFSLSTAWHGSRGRSSAVRGLLFLWAGSVLVSTVALHLHHVLDVAGGILLAGILEYRYRSTLPCPPTTPSQPG